MKKYLAIIMLVMAVAAQSQNFSQYAIQHDSLRAKVTVPDFSYYSKNYDKVFGEYIYSFNTMSFSRRSVYVSDTSFYYNASQNIPYILPLNQNYLGEPGDTAAGIIGVSVMAIQALMNDDLFAKDYSPKNVDELFHPGSKNN